MLTKAYSRCHLHLVTDRNSRQAGGYMRMDASDKRIALSTGFFQSLCESELIVSLLLMGRIKGNNSKSPTRKDFLIFL